MNKKIKLSNNQKAQQEINNFAIGSIGILIIGIVFLFDGVDGLDITLILMSIAMFTIRTKGMMIIVGLLELIFAINFFIILANNLESFSLWPSFIIIIVGIYIGIMGILDIQRYYRVKSYLAK